MYLPNNDLQLSKLHIDKMWALFIGQFNDNVMHRHYALQISITVNGYFMVTDAANYDKSYTQCFINSNVPHQFRSNETCLIILINPLSTLGHQLFKKYNHNEIINPGEDLHQLSIFLSDYLKQNCNFHELIDNIKKYLEQLKCTCESENHFSDERIYRTIQYLEQHFDRIISLEEMSKFCHLSQTRFLHLFKEKTNLNFRRYQLWNKLIKSLPYIKTQSITETAHQFGFTDSSHYTRTFKETFGLSPKILKLLK